MESISPNAGAGLRKLPTLGTNYELCTYISAPFVGETKWRGLDSVPTVSEVLEEAASTTSGKSC